MVRCILEQNPSLSVNLENQITNFLCVSKYSGSGKVQDRSSHSKGEIGSRSQALASPKAQINFFNFYCLRTIIFDQLCPCTNQSSSLLSLLRAVCRHCVSPCPKWQPCLMEPGQPLKHFWGHLLKDNTVFTQISLQDLFPSYIIPESSNLPSFLPLSPSVQGGNISSRDGDWTQKAHT